LDFILLLKINGEEIPLQKIPIELFLILLLLIVGEEFPQTIAPFPSSTGYSLRMKTDRIP